MAEARSAVSELHVPPDMEEGRSSWNDFLRAFRKSMLRRYYRTRNSIRNGTWPTSTNNLASAFVIALVVLLADPLPHPTGFARWLWPVSSYLPLIRGSPVWLKAIIVALTVSVIFFLVLMKVRQYLLQILLSYHGWMYESQRKMPIKMIIWGLLVKFVSGYHPSLFSCQRSLPKLPVPPLHQTLEKLMISLRPVCTKEEFEKLEKGAKDFEANLGPVLQRMLVLRRLWVPNYVTDWWEKYVYLSSRVPLPVNSNYYGIDHSYWHPTPFQTARAASIVYDILLFKRMLDREEMPPLLLRSTIPICMAQYEKLFSTIRRPKEDVDELVHFDSSESRHIVVYSRGIYYSCDVYDSKNQIIAPHNLEDQFNWILRHSEKHKDGVAEESHKIPALTALPRVQWWKIQKHNFSSGINKETLDYIEKAVFVLVLSDDAPSTFSEKGKWYLHGDGKSIWFDKSFHVIVFKNAKCGLNVEHSMADAPAFCHLWELILSKECLERKYTDGGHCMPGTRGFKQGKFRLPKPLIWEVPLELHKSICQAYDFAVKNNDDLDLCVKDHDAFGKGVMKKCKVSPDAFVQMALQLAYYKDTGKFVLTYEASMTRLFLNGRTETVRSCTEEAVSFVKAMMSNEVSMQEKVQLLCKAADRHQELAKDAMCGRGVDRHLFALYVCCRGRGYKSPFLEEVLSKPWTLSTSQQPHQQLQETPDCNLDVFVDKICPGGGFGPVSDDGYGVSYMFPSEAKIFFHISSKHSSKLTDSERFMSLLFESLREIKELFENK